MNHPKITVVLPALNSMTYIRQCVDSILSQTFTDLELLCIDAGSTDGTLELFEEYQAADERVRVIHSEMKSYGHQVNLGLDAARGSYFAIVESDDFIDPHMYERLYHLTRNETIDVVKGNFYDYFDYPGMEPIAAPNGQRKKMPVNGTVFTVNEYPHILEGHPSIWSAIYRLEFLRSIKVRFMEIPGGGWTDNPFFFTTLCEAKTICWTSRPYYYYRKSNPESSSNKMPDLTLPMRRMMDNLDVVERYDLNDEALCMVCERAVTYMNGSAIDPGYPAQETAVREWAAKVFRRLDERIIDRKAEGFYRSKYYNYMSAVMLRRPRSGKVLIYDYMPYDITNKYMGFSENTIAMIRMILAARYDVDIYFLAVRGSHEPDDPSPRHENVYNHLSQQLFTYEVVNSPVLTTKIYDRFKEVLGPFAAEYFITEDGLDDDLRNAIVSRSDQTDIPGHRIVSSFVRLMDIVTALPEHEDISLTSEEYQLILRENDYFHRIMEDTTYGDLFDSPMYKLAHKAYQVYLKVRGGYRCIREHGIKYTIRLFLKRGR